MRDALGLFQLVLFFAQSGFDAVMADGDRGDVRGYTNEPEMVRQRKRGLAVIHCKRAQHPTLRVKNRRGPAGVQPVGQRHSLIVAPERMGGDVFHEHCFFEVSCRAAGTNLRPDGHPVDRRHIFLRKTGRGAVMEVHALLVKQQNRTEHAGRVRLDQTYQRRQRFP